MRSLWLHRTVEILQNKIHNHIFNPSPYSRHEILQDWRKIQFEFRDIIKEMDTLVEKDKCHGILNNQTVVGMSPQQALGDGTAKSR